MNPVRDAVFTALHSDPRAQALHDAVFQAFGRRNRHGGYLLPAEGAPNWDVWRLEETIGLRKTGAPCSIENVVRTFNLDCNAVAMDLTTGLVAARV